MFDIRKAGKQISFLRKSKGITQEELAHMLSVSPQAISKWENGRAMPEVSLLVELASILGKTIDEILLPPMVGSANANFEHVLLLYDEIADFSGKTWPRSMAIPAILSAVKLLMGMEERRDAQNRQVNDDVDYILQAALTSICFGYSWGRGFSEKNCLLIYGLSCEIYKSKDYTEEELQLHAIENILSGYPVIVEPIEYSDMILATGFSDDGKVLKGLPFLDGDDEKNAVISFEKLRNFPEWYKENLNLIRIRPAVKKVSVAAACKDALQEGYKLLSNMIHQFNQPLVGYGLVIYDNWCKLLQEENAKELETIECLYPHIFIHYENKLRIIQFLEYCLHNADDIDRDGLSKTIKKYKELLEIFEKSLHDWLTLEPKSKEEARNMRQGFKEILRRSKELETEALHHWEKALRMVNKNMQKQILTSKGNISFRRVQADERDMGILLKWLTNPEVVHWVYEEGSPWNMQKITEKFGKKAKAEDGLVACFILQNDEEIGYLQMYPIEEDSYKFNDFEDFQLITDGFGIDMFIGETNMWGRGIGAQVVGVIEEYLFDKFKAKVIYVDPSIHNTRAVHFWQKVGFVPMDLIEDYDDCRKKSVLMRKLLKEK